MSVLLVNANSLSIPLADRSVHCIVTSPPYYSLRDYGTATWEGGSAECDHQYQKGGRNPATSAKQITNAGTTFSQYEHVCKKCGAVRVDHQLGLEDTPEAYVAGMVEVFRECWRILRDDGTLWLNIGDSYAGSGGAGGGNVPASGVLKPKDLIGIPWMLAFALRADGWYLRSEIIWHKPNPMPESVTDRPTKAHEQLFLLAKSSRYYYDQDAIREPHEVSTLEREKYGRNPVTPRGWREENAHGTNQGTVTLLRDNPAGRNRRTVWTIATSPYAGSHFATYPPALVEPCIKAGSPIGGVVFDPFAGSGTTLQVARALGRHGVGLDLSLTYLQECARPRLELDALEAWTHGIPAKNSIDDLPLFSGGYQ